MVPFTEPHIKTFWDNNEFVFSGELSVYNEPDGKWTPYETYMFAKRLETCGDSAQLLIRFPANCAEDNRLHTHNHSSRIISVVSGTGEFIFRRDGEGDTHRLSLVPGMTVCMPRGVLHTFKAHGDGMLVTSWHIPFIELEVEQAIQYPKEGEGYRV